MGAWLGNAGAETTPVSLAGRKLVMVVLMTFEQHVFFITFCEHEGQ